MLLFAQAQRRNDGCARGEEYVEGAGRSSSVFVEGICWFILFLFKGGRPPLFGS